MKTAIVIVVYNKWCGEAYTCKAVQNAEIKPDLVLVVDNSTKPIDNENYCKENGWLYYSMNSNVGLTKAYNTALEILKGKVDIIIWADDDTRFPKNYFKSVVLYAEKNQNASVFLPIVKSGEMIISPCIFCKKEMIVIQSVKDLENKEISGINSGMAVRTELYEEYRYDEKYFLDYVDHDFLFWCREKGFEFCVMENLLLQQSFFAQSGASKKAKRVRFRIFRKDYSRFQIKCGAAQIDIIKTLLKKFIYEQFVAK